MYTTPLYCTSALHTFSYTVFDQSVVGCGALYRKVWIFGALFVYDIVLGIALRLAAIGATAHGQDGPTAVSRCRLTHQVDP